ncbi:MAG TPA: BA14K family protein [Xanthobacteraceae bacterium]|jgi:hypothetical protein
MLNAKRILAAALLTSASVAMMAGPASAMPAAPGLALQKAAPSQVETVRWGRCWGCGFGGGFVAGAIVGGALAAPYYYGPGYYYPGPYYGSGPYYPAGPAYGGPAAPAGDAVSYCMRRFHSYDPRTGTFLGLDGARHPCP